MELIPTTHEHTPRYGGVMAISHEILADILNLPLGVRIVRVVDGNTPGQAMVFLEDDTGETLPRVAPGERWPPVTAWVSDRDTNRIEKLEVP